MKSGKVGIPVSHLYTRFKINDVIQRADNTVDIIIKRSGDENLSEIGKAINTSLNKIALKRSSTRGARAPLRISSWRLQPSRILADRSSLTTFWI